MKLVSSTAIIKLENTIKAIENVYNQLNEEYKNFFDWNFKRHAGIVRTCREIGIEERTYYRWRDNIIYNAGMEMGLL